MKLGLPALILSPQNINFEEGSVINTMNMSTSLVNKLVKVGVDELKFQLCQPATFKHWLSPPHNIQSTIQTLANRAESVKMESLNAVKMVFLVFLTMLMSRADALDCITDYGHNLQCPSSNGASCFPHTGSNAYLRLCDDVLDCDPGSDLSPDEGGENNTFSFFLQCGKYLLNMLTMR